jgi:hypothetical protein
MNDQKTIEKLKRELQTARESETKGNLGRARVCARRAAGWAIQAYLDKERISLESNNALDHIKYFAKVKDLPPRYYEVLHHLTIKLEKDSVEADAYYPIEGVNLIEEAQWLAEDLLGVSLD